MMRAVSNACDEDGEKRRPFGCNTAGRVSMSRLAHIHVLVPRIALPERCIGVAWTGARANMGRRHNVGGQRTGGMGDDQASTGAHNGGRTGIYFYIICCFFFLVFT